MNGAPCWPRRSPSSAQRPDDAVLRKELRLKIRDSLQKLYILIGCSTRLCGRSRAKVDVALRAFGFELEPVRTEPHQGDVMIVGLAMMAGNRARDLLRGVRDRQARSLAALDVLPDPAL